MATPRSSPPPVEPRVVCQVRASRHDETCAPHALRLHLLGVSTAACGCVCVYSTCVSAVHVCRMSYVVCRVLCFCMCCVAGGTDVAREERMRRCLLAYDILVAMLPNVQHLSLRPGALGWHAADMRAALERFASLP
jgi:hypothetical protein